MDKPNVLILCTGNSCRSQMMEGFARHHLGKDYNFYSAGVETHGLNKRAVKVMMESGVDISSHKSKSIDEYADINFDAVITVCGDAHERCPAYLKITNLIHKGFPDPANAQGSEEQILLIFRSIRDQIEHFVLKELPNELRNS